MRRFFVGGAGCVAVVMACVHLASTGCNEPPEVNYGNPNTLDRKNLPGDGGTEPLNCTGDASVGAFDGGCPTYENDIFPLVRSTGKWKCTDPTCHGGASAPLFDNDDPEKSLTELKAITVGGKGYIISGDAGATESTIICNLQGTCGSPMPKPPGLTPTNEELCMVAAWLQCGAR